MSRHEPSPTAIANRAGRLLVNVLAALGAIALLLAGIVWWVLWAGGIRLGPVNFETSGVQANSQLASTMSTMSSGDARADCRRVVVIDETASPLGPKVTVAMAEELRKTKGVQRVDLGEAAIPRGGRLPGLVVRLRLEKLDESDALTARTIKARLMTETQTGVAGGFGGYSDGQSGPRLEINLRSTLDYEATCRGDGLGPARYRLTGPAIGKQFGESLRKEIEKWGEKPGLMPELPAEFDGPFRETNELAFLHDLGAKEVMAGTGMLTHQESLWRWTDRRPPEGVIDDVLAKMKARGWQIRCQQDRPKTATPKILPGPAFAWLAKGDQLVHVFEDRPVDEPRSPTSLPSAAKKDLPRTFCLHYFDRFSAGERQKAIDTLLAQPGRLKEAGRFEGLMSDAQHKAYFQKLEAANPAAPEDCLRLAEHYQPTDRAKAETMLRRAVVLLAVAPNAADLQSRIDELAKKLGKQDLVKRPVEAREVAALGLPTLDKPVEKTVGVDEPVVGWLERKGKISFAQGVVVAVPDSRRYELRYVLGDKMGRVSGVHADLVPATGLWKGEATTGFNGVHILMHAKELGPGRFQVRLQCTH